jgi:hypothetical protein
LAPPIAVKPTLPKIGNQVTIAGLAWKRGKSVDFTAIGSGIFRSSN